MKKQTIWFSDDSTTNANKLLNGRNTRYRYPDVEFKFYEIDEPVGGWGQASAIYEKADHNNKVRIGEGMASTDAVDRAGEIVDPESFRANLESFKQFPVLLLNHQFFAQPIGKILEAEIRDNGW